MSQLGEQSFIKGNWGKKYQLQEKIQQNVITLMSGCNWEKLTEREDDIMIEKAFRIINKIENY